MEFRRQIEREKKLLFATFDDLRLFEKLVRRHLDQWLIDHEQGRGPEKVGPSPPSTPPPDSDATLKHQEGPSAKREALDEAERLADEGHLVDCEAKFAEATAAGNDPDAFNRYGHYLLRVGRLGQAASACRRVVELGELSNDLAWTAIGYGNLGVIYQKLGQFKRAEEMYLKALALDEQIGRKKEQSIQYANLASIYVDQAELERAEEFYLKAIAIARDADREDRLAEHLLNIAQVYVLRNELDRAEKVLNTALDINRRLGRKDGVGMALGNLGLVYMKQGKFDQAEKIYRQALEINQQLGRVEGIAIQLGNLGSLSQARGDDAGAREQWIRCRDMFTEIGMIHKAEETQKWIDEMSQRE